MAWIRTIQQVNIPEINWRYGIDRSILLAKGYTVGISRDIVFDFNVT
jgi:hypothetical protein